MNLIRMNPWWETNQVPRDLAGIKRDILPYLLSYFPKKLALLLHGARRVGKTTLLYQMINTLLSDGVSPFHILYFTFDMTTMNLEELLLAFERDVLKDSIRNQEVYIFLDEIQKHPNWWNKIKVLYDLYPNIHWVLSGSNGLLLHKKMSESLAGRVYSFQIQPLNFKEFLSFNEVSWDEKHISIQIPVLEPYFNRYIETSGFPGLFKETDSNVIHKYFTETVENRIIYQDIPMIFKIEEPMLLQQLFKIISNYPGMTVYYSHLANDLQRDWRTIETYLNYLEKSYLLRQLTVFSPNMLTSRKKLKKYYPRYSAFSFIQRDRKNIDKTFFGHVVESLLAQFLETSHYLTGKQQDEIDLVGRKKDTFFPVEVKYRKTITSSDINKMANRMNKWKFHYGQIITQYESKTVRKEDQTIQLIPCIQYILSENEPLR